MVLEEQGLRPGSVARYLTPVKALFATAWEDGVIERNPTIGVRVSTTLPHDESAQRSMTQLECRRLFASLPLQWRPFHQLVLETGMRVSEALGLEWSDVALAPQSRIEVRRQHYRGTTGPLKTRASRRRLPLSRSLAAQLDALRPVEGRGPVFVTRNGTRYLERNIRRVLARAASEAELGWVSFHSFRHTCASLLFAAGKTPLQVSGWLGHADPAFTLRTYSHLIDPGLGGAELFDELTSPPGLRA